MKKNYILDTNILIQSPESLFGFDDNTVYVTDTVIQELDGLKMANGDVGANARASLRYINEFRSKGNLLSGVENGPGVFKVEYFAESETKNSHKDLDVKKPDNRIILTALNIKSKSENETILVTNDTGMAIIADINGLKAQSYQNLEVPEFSYDGVRHLTVSEDILNKVYKSGSLAVNEIPLENEPVENEYFILHHELDEEILAIVRYRNRSFYGIDKSVEHPFGINAKNEIQRIAINALSLPAYDGEESHDSLPLVIIKGPAGTAKTFLSLAVGLDQSCYFNPKKKNGYAKIMVSRSNVLSDNDIGFLPGAMEDKMTPLVAPLFDNLEVLLRGATGETEEQVQYQINDLVESGVFCITSIAYMRGRSLVDTYLIIDEVQNCTPSQVLEIVTRAGKNCKIVLCGDPDQIDNPKLSKRNNGLVYVSEKMRGSHLCAQITFTHEDTVRSELAREAAKRLKKR